MLVKDNCWHFLLCLRNLLQLSDQRYQLSLLNKNYSASSRSCSKIRGEERKILSKNKIRSKSHSLEWQNCEPRVARAFRGPCCLRLCRSRTRPTHQISCSFSVFLFLHSSPQILGHKRDCSHSKQELVSKFPWFGTVINVASFQLTWKFAEKSTGSLFSWRTWWIYWIYTVH